jgi:trehalose 6-phosphate synthase/phosphatase
LERELPFKNVIVVSNRLPIRIARTGPEKSIESGSGGLVRALSPVLRNTGGVWVGWDGDPEGGAPASLLKAHAKHVGYRLRPISLTQEEVTDYYWGFSNETLWPLFHDMLDRAHFSRAYWQAYCSANRKFGKAAARGTKEGDLVWVHDYQLILASKYVKEMGSKATIAFFLHIPFPSTDLFMRLPWREEFIDAFLLYDLVGFQTEQDRRNFLHCVRNMYPECKISGAQRVSTVERRGTSTLVGTFPISIDHEDFHQTAKLPEVRERAAAFQGEMGGRRLVLGVDRLDYTKGIPYRLRAFDLALKRYPELRTRLTLVQVLVPSRTHVPDYAAMKRGIDERIGRMNGEHTYAGWTPIHYIYRSLDKRELVALYRACDIAMVTPLRDGMNLIAKEYCASCVEGDEGVLILSEFAGAARQMGRHALLVNPYHVEHVAEQIYTAYSMSKEERGYRMKRLRADIRRNDVFRWATQYLAAAARTQRTQ